MLALLWILTSCLLMSIVATELEQLVTGQGEISTSTVTLSTLQAFSDAWNEHDLDKLMSFMSEDCEFHAVAGPDLMGKSWIGRESVREGFSQAFINFPDAQWLHPVHFLSPLSSKGIESRGVTESTFVGTKRTADGQQVRVEARMVDIFTFDERGKIKVKNAFRKDRPPFPVSP